MLGLSEYSDQPTQGDLHARLRGRWRHVRRRRLFADDELQLGNETNDQRAVGIERTMQLLPPRGEFGLGLGKEVSAESSKGLCQCGVWNISRQLIALARREQSSCWNKRSVQLAHDRRLSDS